MRYSQEVTVITCPYTKTLAKKKILETVVGYSFKKCCIIKVGLLEAQRTILVGKTRTSMVRIKI